MTHFHDGRPYLAVKSQIDDDWLVALELIHDQFPDAPLYPIMLHTVVRLDLNNQCAHRPAIFKYAQGRTIITVSDSVLDFPMIERVEFFMWFACESWKFLKDLPWVDFKYICTRLGCDYSHTANPRERWRWILSLPNQEKFGLWKLEDRPKCLFCDKAMPTNSDCHPTRRGMHENCGYELDRIQEVVRQKVKAMEVA